MLMINLKKSISVLNIYHDLCKGLSNLYDYLDTHYMKFVYFGNI